jgi:hypothetical protein
MRLLSKILWFFAFLVATFCWMVLFEHGFSMKSFSEGMREELRELVAKVAGGKAVGAESKETAPPEPAPPKTDA